MAAQRDDVGGCAAARRETRGNRLDRAADFGEAQPEFVIQAHSDAPREHVRIEVVPVTRVEHARADPGLGGHETLRGQCLHDFAHDRARDLEAFYEVRLGRHVRAGLMDSLRISVPRTDAIWSWLDIARSTASRLRRATVRAMGHI